jgi:hypothetical protein
LIKLKVLKITVLSSLFFKEEIYCGEKGENKNKISKLKVHAIMLILRFTDYNNKVQ